MSNEKTGAAEAIAIVGMSGRFPGAQSVAEFWRLLRDGAEAIRSFSDEELAAAGVERARLSLPNFVGAKGVLEGADLFDAAFFGFTPREAEMMDPQHRVFMECAWSALEDAGYDPERFGGAIGLFAGECMNTYLLFNLLSNRALVESVGALQTSIQNRTDHLTTHVAYELNLKGPSVTLQTACSTSLVALHVACQSLLNGECDMALAGGVAVSVPLKNGYLYQEGGIYSPDGHCRAFDARAQGTVEGNGAGVVVLRRLADALADGDCVRAVILGSAINNDGSLKVGYTAPGVSGQAEVIAEAHAVAGVTSDTITYVETHGTGTVLGDPIEIQALTEAFRNSAAGRNYCAVGSVKTNIGHLDAAAGVAGLIKTVLALEHRELPPSLNFESPNPRLDIGESPFYVNAKLAPWQTRNGVPRRAGVSSFGIGGTNAHVVLEEAPEAEPEPTARTWHVLPLSAKTNGSLDAATLALREHLAANSDLDPADVAYSMQVGRRAFGRRRAVVYNDLSDAVRSLETLDSRRVFNGLQEPKERPVVFMFPGQGAQYVGMGLGLYRTEPLLREVIDRCAELLRPYLGLDLRETLYPAESRSAEAAERLTQTALTQPALFAVEYALSRLWMSRGVRPAAMIGHSIGEYVAACLAGVFSLEDALRLVAARGRLMQSLPPGAMLVVPLPEREVTSLIEGRRLSLAAVNAPSLCVVSGEAAEVVALERELAKRELVSRRLHTSHAFHSDMMEPILKSFVEEFAGIKLNPPSTPYLSNVTGTWVTAAEATDPTYWAAHLRQTVRFGDGAGELFKDADRLLLEVGPGRTLSTLMRQHPRKGAGQLVLSSLRHADESEPDEAFILTSLARLWLSGVEIDWPQLYSGERRRRVPLPTYQFECQRYWVEPRVAAGDAAPADAVSKNPDISEWFYAPSWRRSAVTPADDAESGGRRWLIFEDECGLGAQLAARLEAAGGRVIAVRPGEAFGREGSGTYTVNPRRREDYVSLLRALSETGDSPQSVAHLWNVTRGAAGPAAADELTWKSFYSLLFLAQAIGEQPAPRDDAGAERLRLFIVSNGMQEVSGEEELCAEKALALGPCRVIPQEYTHVDCRSIDVELPREGGAGYLVGQLLSELSAGGREQVVAYRGRHRWVQNFERLRLGAADGGPLRLRERGTYLLTGGLGGMALELAGYFARAARARLVLVGRTGLPEREAWDGWLASHGDDDGVSHKIRKVLELEEAGAEVLVVAADVSDRAQLGEAVRRARSRFGGINGVVHAAGVPGGGVIQLKTAAAAAAVLAPKVGGTRLLEELTSDGLDFFVCCSSRASVLGGFGNVDYCAANAYLDAFAHKLARRGDFAVSLDWDAWQAVGMLAEKAARVGDRRAVPTPEPSRTGHPLLGVQVSDGRREEVFSNRFGVSYWVLDDHRIVGAAVMPGTAYLEMARAAVERHAPGREIEIRDAFFLAPLGVRDDESCEVRIHLERDGDEFEFRVLSRAGEGVEGDGEWQKYSIGRVGFGDGAPPRRHDLAAIAARCKSGEVVIRDNDEIDPDLGPRWQSLRRVLLGDRELLATLELPEEFAADMEALKLHPALLDRATGTAKHYLVKEGHYLPMSYRRLRIKAPLPRKVYTYIKYNDNGPENMETITFDIVLMDENGVGCVEIEGFSQKRVNQEAEAIKVLTAPKGRRAGASAGHEGAARNGAEGIYGRKLGEGISPDEGVEAFRRVLSADVPPQVVVSTKDLHASIEQARAMTQARVAEEIEMLRPAQAAHPRPQIQTEYAAPSNEDERALVEILQEMLGIEQVGVRDNFFELGGDSVLAIQIIARAKRAGLHITPQQIFNHPTVAELATIAGADRGVDAKQTPVTGPVPLTPAQHWFFEHAEEEEAGGGQSRLLDVRAPLDPALLGKAVGHLFGYHDALRLRFSGDAGDWQQENAGADEYSVPFEHVDLSGLPEAEREGAAAEMVARQRADFNLSEGPLVRFTYFDFGASGRLSVVAHRLVSDDLSSIILIEDLEAVYEQMRRGEEAKLPPKTTSFKHWAERLVAHAASEVVAAEADFWTGPRYAEAPTLPEDYAVGAGDEGGTRAVTVWLGEAETRALAEEVPRAYHTQINDALLTALAQSFAEWTGDPQLLMELEDHGREALFGDIDLSRTVGSFTNRFPIVLSLEKTDGPGEALKAVKEQLRAVPRWGFGYSLLRYLSPDESLRERLRGLPQPRVSFRYAHPSNEVAHGSPLFAAAREEAARAHATPAHDFEFRVADDAGRLRVELTYGSGPRAAEVAVRLAEGMLEALRSIIAHCQSPGAGGFTPSDFPIASLDEGKLSKLSRLLGGANDEKRGPAKAQPAELDARSAAAEVEAALAEHSAVGKALVVARRNGLHADKLVAYVVPRRAAGVRQRALDFSLFFFSDDNATSGGNKYRLYLEGARFADRKGFAAVWTPERHFHESGGPYPSPSLLSAALATTTERIQLRAGSVVLPLQHSVRVAEEWSMVDNLSGGRVGVSFTSGWIPKDFSFFPERFADKRGALFRGIEEVQRLWRGESLTARDGAGNLVELTVFPKPLQPELPIWLTCSGDPQMFVKAGELGLNVLTALLTQSIEEVADKIALYRKARADAGYDPDGGQVTLMMHTFVGGDTARVLEKVRGPLCDYLRSHVGLMETMVKSLNIQIGFDKEQYLDYLIEFAFERYYRTASLIGTPEACLKTTERLREIGVNEVACFIDFGVDIDSVLDGLRHLNELRELARPSAPTCDGDGVTAEELSDFLRLKLPEHMRPESVVLLDALPHTPGGEVDRAALAAGPHA